MKLKRLWAFYVFFTILSLLVNWPGRAHPDSLDVIWQAQNPEDLGDWHSPYLVFLYGLLGPLFGYPGGALVLQSALLMMWPALVLTHIYEEVASNTARLFMMILWVVICMLFIALAGQVMKDVLLVGFMSAFFSVFVIFVVNENAIHKSGLLLMVGLFAMFVLVRASNIVVLISCLFAVLFTLRRAHKWKPVYGYRSVVMVLLVLVALKYSNFLFVAADSHPEASPIVFDLAGISKYGKVNLFEYKSGVTAYNGSKSLNDCYTAKQSDPFIWGECGKYYQIVKGIEGLSWYWVTAVASHPYEYLRHRIGFAAELLKKDGSANEVIIPKAPFSQAANSRQYLSSFEGDRVPDFQLWHPLIGFVPFGVVANMVLDSPVGQPLIWCIILAGNLAYLLFRRSREMAPLLLSVCGLSNLVAFIFLSGSDDLRYLLPTFMCSLGVMVLWLGRLKSCSNIASKLANQE